MISGRVSHGLIVIDLKLSGSYLEDSEMAKHLEEPVMIGNDMFPYVVGGYDENFKNIKHNELLLIKSNLAIWTNPEKWSNLKSLASSRSQFALTSISRS